MTNRNPRPWRDSPAFPSDYIRLVRMWPPSVPVDEAAYDNLVELIDELNALPKRTRDQERYLDTISVLLEHYERQHVAEDFAELTPVEALRALVDANDMTASQLGELLGDRALGSRLLRGEREISKAHARILAKRFAVGLDLFIGYSD